VLDTIITSKTRLKMLLKFFSNSQSTAYLREMAKEFGESTNSIRHELNNLTEAGYLLSREEGRNIYYSANTAHPIYPELKSLVHKYLGLDKILDNVVQKVVGKLGQLELAFITGDYARGRDTGIIDLVLVGKVDLGYLQRYIAKVEKLIHRKVRTLVLTHKEFEQSRKSLDSDKALLLWKVED
jgi:DNA-binding transcriptional ArsR family regulator